MPQELLMKGKAPMQCSHCSPGRHMPVKVYFSVWRLQCDRHRGCTTFFSESLQGMESSSTGTLYSLLYLTPLSPVLYPSEMPRTLEK